MVKIQHCPKLSVSYIFSIIFITRIQVSRFRSVRKVFGAKLVKMFQLISINTLIKIGVKRCFLGETHSFWKINFQFLSVKGEGGYNPLSVDFFENSRSLKIECDIFFTDGRIMEG